MLTPDISEQFNDMNLAVSGDPEDHKGNKDRVQRNVIPLRSQRLYTVL